MASLDSYFTFGVPKVCYWNVYLRRLFDKRDIGIIDKDISKKSTGIIDKYKVNNKLIYVDSEYGITEEWLSQPLGGNIKVYIPIYGGCEWLPLISPRMWVIGEVDNPVTKSTSVFNENNLNWNGQDTYLEVKYTDETCVADLICNAYMYTLSLSDKAFIKHHNPDWNAIKGLVRKFLLIISGGIEDRIADYGRLILFMLSKLNLTENEQSVINKLSEFFPEASDLTSVIDREYLIQKFVSEAKKNPEAFLAWGEEWTKFWWE